MVFNSWAPGLCIRSLYHFIPHNTKVYPHQYCWFMLLVMCFTHTHTFKLSHGGLSVSSEAMRTGLWSLQTATDLEKIVTFEGGFFHWLLSGLMDSHCRSFKVFFCTGWYDYLFSYFPYWFLFVFPVVGNVTFLLNSEIPHWPKIPKWTRTNTKHHQPGPFPCPMLMTKYIYTRGLTQKWLIILRI